MIGYVYPSEESGNASLVCIPAELIPIVSGSLRSLMLPFKWETDADYRRGYNAIAGVLAQMPNNYLERLVRASEYTARVLDTSLNGAAYSVEGDEVIPAIPLAPPASTDEPNAMRAHLGRLWQLGENAATGSEFAAGAGIEDSPPLPESLSWAARLLSVQGVTDAGWFSPDEPVTLKRLLEAARLNSDDDRTIVRNAAQQGATAVDTAANAADALGDYLQAAADLGTDGGVIAVQLFTSAAMLGMLQRIAYALNGNPPTASTAPAPLSFILAGDETASATNNVLTVLKDTGADTGALGALIAATNAAIAATNEALSTANAALSTANAALSEIQDATRDTSSAIGLLTPGDGNLPALAYLALIADSTERSADCCEGQSGGGGEEEPAPEPGLDGCDSDFTPTGNGVAVVLDFSTLGQLAGPEMISTVPNVVIDDNPYGAGRVIRVTAGIVQLRAVLTRASNDDGVYGIDINPYIGEGQLADLPSPTLQNLFPASNCVVSLFRAVDFGNDPVIYEVTVTRSEGGNTTPYAGEQPQLTFFEVETAS